MFSTLGIKANLISVLEYYYFVPQAAATQEVPRQIQLI
jgi:hypothetical protein